MNIQVLLFGPYASAAGADRVALEFPQRDDVTVAEVLAALSEKAPSIANMLPAARLAVNERFVRPDHHIVDSDECALIGLVSGG